MATTKNLGGDRLGSGNKMDVHLKGFERSSHNLSRAWRSTMAPGTLVPFLVEPGLPGDTFDIDLSTMVRTLPTNGPIFGSFKMQLDVFKCPIRLYNKQLHNNKLGIGMEMSKVKFPQMRLETLNPVIENGTMNQQQINQSSLLAYLGTRGLGKSNTGAPTVVRNINAMPLLMYWDIYKNYYANKQEEIGAVINYQVNATTTIGSINRVVIKNASGVITSELNNNLALNGGGEQINPGFTFDFYGENMRTINIQVKAGVYQGTLTWQSLANYGEITGAFGDQRRFTCTSPFWMQWDLGELPLRMDPGADPVLSDTYSIKTFELNTIDMMREELLGAPSGEPYVINYTENPALGEIKIGQTLPYSATTDSYSLAVAGQYERLAASVEMGGLGIKTYQSDRFNNWLSTEWIDGANGIAAVTAVDTSSGSFTMDTLNLSQKVYDMLNRIMVSGGSYNDWVEAVYDEKFMHMAENPIYVGGMSTEIVFNEVVSTADSTADGVDQPLGTLAGRGKDTNQKGGTIRVKCDEPCYIMGIVSLTPRIDYSQGNKWWTRLETMDDLHKPSLDGIGFQELITDEMAAWDTEVDTDGNPIYKSAGKQPAWIHYMTAVNECYGNFANQNMEMFMTLNRRYEPDQNGNIKDLTTYIDPTKYNYAFAVQELKAQNFWVQIASDIIARRKMSAKIIPNL